MYKFKVIESKDRNYKTIEDWISHIKTIAESNYNFKVNEILSTKETSHEYEMLLTAIKLN